jgi:hypothetical protein
MIRLRWAEPERDNQSGPIHWRRASTILATLFLNASFCVNYGLAGRFSDSIAFHVVTLGVGALVITALFFIGPAMAVQAAERRVFGVIENSFGSIPTLVLRLCAIVFLTWWIAELMAVPTLWALERVPGRELSPWEMGLIAAAVLAFLFLTSSQGIRTDATLALFTVKLCLALLIAALIRVRHGWSAVAAGLPSSGQSPAVEELWYSLSRIAFYLAPLSLLAADFAFHQRRKQVAVTGVMGIALPLFGALLISVVIGVAIHASGLYVPSLNPTIAMALFSRVADSAMKGRMLVFAITTFGAIRFGIKALLDSASIVSPKKLRWLLAGCSTAAIVWLSLHPYDLFAASIGKASEIAATCLVIVTAVLTADFLNGWGRTERRKRIDWIAVLALLTALATPCLLLNKYVWDVDHYWLLRPMPPYAVGLLICLFGRATQRALVARGFAGIPVE